MFKRSSASVYLVANRIPIYYEACHRCFNFTQTAAACNCDLINFVVFNGSYYCQMKSALDPNAVTCSSRFGIPI
jgi:hypothetical protein